uniref:Selectin P n=1 Tax=Seriola lalandi dorsalis TaxID=1841481 RepID=A0A3B4XY57_SERLL
MTECIVAELTRYITQMCMNAVTSDGELSSHYPLTGSSLAVTTLGWTYHYSNKTMNWTEARLYCQSNYTDMVVIQSQIENDYLVSYLPERQGSPYYWIGITKNHKNETWTWIGNNSTWVGNESWAENEPNNNHSTEFCVEIYIKKGKNRGKWNDEKCSHGKRPVCYKGIFHWFSESNTKLFTALMSNGVSSSSVVQCNSLEAPPHASVECQDPLEVYSYGSICTVQCEEGFDLIGANMTQCSSQGSWSHTLPVCQAKKCNPINPPPHGSLSCSDPHGSFSFGSHCMTTCDEGFLLNGTANAECTSLGMWNIPHCLAKRCPTLNSPPHGSFSCYDPHGEFSFGSRCTSTCEEGFVLNGTANTDCTSVGKWSRDVPRCLAKRCPTLNSPPHGSSSCSDPHVEFSFGSRCTSACEEGFVLSGMADTECTSVGTWSTETPHCLAKKCPSLNSPPHGSSSCSDPHGEFRFGSRCTSACEEGFVLNGTADTECTSVGTWSTETPRCLAKKCPTLNPLAHGTFLCSDPHGDCGFECNEGFWLRGTPTMTCSNSGHWSQDLPTCQPGLIAISVLSSGTGSLKELTLATFKNDFEQLESLLKIA